MKIIQLQGTDDLLYQLVAPLVMNPDVLKQNYNYPFRTSEDYTWFIALEEKQVVGFVPLEDRKRECVINNYYIKDKSCDTLKLLLERIVAQAGAVRDITAVCFLEDKDVFLEFGFIEEKTWTRYVKMKKKNAYESPQKCI